MGLQPAQVVMSLRWLMSVLNFKSTVSTLYSTNGLDSPFHVDRVAGIISVNAEHTVSSIRFELESLPWG